MFFGLVQNDLETDFRMARIGSERQNVTFNKKNLNKVNNKITI